jgi:hypothetical protein
MVREPPGWSISGMASLPQAPPDRSGVPGRAAGTADDPARPPPPSASGEPPPLPKHLNASGKCGWRSADWSSWPGVVVVVTGSTTHFDVADTRVLQAIADVRTPWLTRVADVTACLPLPPPSTSSG